MEINRVIEIDCDTARNPTVIIRIVKQTPHRAGIIPHDEDILKDLILIREGALAAILHAEKLGACKPGEYIKRFVEGLHEAYIDISAQVKKVNFDENGNKINT